MIEPLTYGQATKLIASMRFLRRFMKYFNPYMVNLPEFESSLIIEIDELCKYRKLLKKSAYEQ